MLPQLTIWLFLASPSTQHVLHQHIQPDPKYMSNDFHPLPFNPPIVESFEDFVEVFNVSFASPTEEAKRREVFETNYAAIQAHNLVNDIKKVVTKFSALTHEEITASYTGAQIRGEDIARFNQMPEYQAGPRQTPTSFDWRSVEGAVTEVKNQGGCGSCWAFAATAAIETHQFLKTWEKMDLSEQAILDCTYTSTYNGCNGGWGLIAYRENPVQYYETSYPYTGKGDEPCRTPQSDPGLEIASTISGSMKVQSWNAEAMRQALVENGPLDVSIYVAEDFHSWDWNHVYSSEECNLRWTTHEVVIVGYGEEEDGTKFWTVKNSWGTGWGQDGYFRIARGVNMCSIEMLPVFPTIPDTSPFTQSPGHSDCNGDVLLSFPASCQQACQRACYDHPTCSSWTLRTSDHFCWLKSGACEPCRKPGCKEDGIFLSGIRDDAGGRS